MSPGPQDRLYFPLARTYRRMATRAQIVLTAAAVILSLGVIAVHYCLVFQPSQMDFALASLPYEPWFLVQEEAAPAMEYRAPAEEGEAAPGHPGRPPVAMPSEGVDPARPNLIPQTGVNYTPSELTGKVEGYLKSKGAGALNEDMATKAQQLADSYASLANGGGSAFPFSAELERSVLEQGWLWDLREGCEPQLYLRLPPGRLDKLGCGLPEVPIGKPFGMGMAQVEDRKTGQGPVIAVVWDN